MGNARTWIAVVALEAKVEFRRLFRRHALRCTVSVPIASGDPSADVKLELPEIKRRAKQLLKAERRGYYRSILRSAHSKQALCFMVYIMFGGDLAPPEDLYQEGTQAIQAALSQLNAWLRNTTRCRGLLISAAIAFLAFRPPL